MKFLTPEEKMEQATKAKEPDPTVLAWAGCLATALENAKGLPPYSIPFPRLRCPRPSVDDVAAYVMGNSGWTVSVNWSKEIFIFDAPLARPHRP